METDVKEGVGADVGGVWGQRAGNEHDSGGRVQKISIRMQWDRKKMTIKQRYGKAM